VLFPSMSEAHGRDDQASVRAQTDLGTRALVLIMVATFGVIIILSRPLLRLLYGNAFEAAGAVLPIMLVAVLFGTVDEAAVNFLTSTSQRGVRITAEFSVAGLVVGAIVWLLLVPNHGVTGVALGYLIGTAASVVPILALVWRRERHHWTWLSVRFGLAVVVLVTVAVNEQTGHTSALSAITLAVVFLVGWLALSYPDVRRVLPVILRR
jgi:O-antigen/teichoic acid export membrane protein